MDKQVSRLWFYLKLKVKEKLKSKVRLEDDVKEAQLIGYGSLLYRYFTEVKEGKLKRFVKDKEVGRLKTYTLLKDCKLPILLIDKEVLKKYDAHFLHTAGMFTLDLFHYELLMKERKDKRYLDHLLQSISFIALGEENDVLIKLRWLEDKLEGLNEEEKALFKQKYRKMIEVRKMELNWNYKLRGLVRHLRVVKV